MCLQYAGELIPGFIAEQCLFRQSSNVCHHHEQMGDPEGYLYGYVLDMIARSRSTAFGYPWFLNPGNRRANFSIESREARASEHCFCAWHAQ